VRRLLAACAVVYTALAAALPPAALGQTTTVPDNTTTTQVPRIVGDPLPLWVVGLVAVSLLAVIIGAGLLAQRAIRRRDGAG
jgi:hypothetical protein